MFQCLIHGWTSEKQSCPECKTERAEKDFQEEMRRDRGGSRCSWCRVREARYGHYCGECAGDMDL